MTKIKTRKNNDFKTMQTFVSKHVIEMLNNALSSNQTQETVYNEIDDTLRQKFKNKKMYQRARRQFAFAVRRFNKLKNSSFTIPAAPLLVKREIPSQTVDAIVNARQVSAFIEQLPELWLSSQSYNTNESAGFFLLSLIVYNGVYNKTVIETIFSKLSNSIGLIKFINFELLINVDIENSSFGNSKVSNDIVSYNYTVVLHNISKAWLLRFKKLHTVSELNVESAHECIKQALQAVGADSGINLLNLTKYSYYSCQFLQNCKLDQFGINILKRKFDNSSCNNQQLKIYDRKIISETKITKFNQNDEIKSVNNLSFYDKDYINKSVSNINNIIKQKDYIDLLILEINDSAIQIIVFITLWMLIKSKLNTEQLNELSKRYNSYFNKNYSFSRSDLKPVRASSLRTYFSTFVRTFLQICKDRSLMQFTASEYEDVYEQILHRKLDSRKAAASQRLIEFHQILVRFCNAPSVEFNQFSNLRICKTDLIPPYLFDAFLKSIQASNSLSVHEKYFFNVMYILAYRLALRVNEILYLYVSDVAVMPNENIHIIIRKHGDKNQKSSSAHRRILLSAFLNKDEIRKFHHVYSTRIRQCDQQEKSYNTPIFRRDDLQPFVEQELNHYIQDFFRPLYLNNITFHTLRHSCINHLFLVLRQSALVTHFTDYSIEQQLKIRYALTQARNTQQNHYELAFFSGHLQPSTTAASYLHLLDIDYTFGISKITFGFIRQHYINIIQTQHDEVKLYMRDLSKYLFDHLYGSHNTEKTLEIAPPKKVTYKDSTYGMLGAQNSVLTFDILHYYVYSELQHLHYLYNSNIDEIYNFRKTAEFLKSFYINNKKTPILFNTDFLNNNPNTLIGPLPKTKIEKNILIRCEKNYANVHLNFREDLMKFFEIYLNKVNSTDSKFIFKSNEKIELRIFIKIVQLLFGSEYIMISTNQDLFDELSYIVQKFNINNMSIDNNLKHISFCFKPKTSSKALGIFKICIHLLLIYNLYNKFPN